MRNLKYSLILLLSLLLSCATTSDQDTIQTQDYFDNFVFSSPAADRQSFEIFVKNNLLLIRLSHDYSVSPVEIGIYNPQSGLLAVLHGIFEDVKSQNKKFRQSIDVNFYHVKNKRIRQLFEDIVKNYESYKDWEKRAQMKRVFNGNLPYITSDGKYEGDEILVRIEGEKNFYMLQQNGLPISKFQSFDGYPKDSVYKAEIRSKYEHFISKFGTIGDIFGYIKLDWGKIILKPKIIDKSGFFDNSKIITHKVDHNNESGICTIKVFAETSKFGVRINPAYYSLPYKEDDYLLEPTVEILSKKHTDFSPQLKFSNKDIVLELKAISIIEGQLFSRDIDFAFDIANIGQKFISIKKIAFYIQDGTFTWGNPVTLPPKTILENRWLKTSAIKESIESRRFVRSVINYITQEVTLEKAKSLRIRIGTSVLYEVEGKELTLYIVRDIPFVEALKGK